MKLRLRLFGLPLHPLLVHFPIVFWFLALALDIAAFAAGPDPWWDLAYWAALLGLAIGAIAIATGLLEYLQPTLVGIDLRLASRHGVRTTLAWCTFLTRTILASNLPATEASILICLALDVIGCSLLAQGVYFGTKQVYDQLESD